MSQGPSAAAQRQASDRIWRWFQAGRTFQPDPRYRWVAEALRPVLLPDGAGEKRKPAAVTAGEENAHER